MSNIHNLSDPDLPESCFVFKHSTICPISSTAAGEVRRMTLELPLYWINVVEQRELSNWAAGHLSVTHQSPQLIKIVGGKAVQVWNHGEIREGQLNN